MLYFFSLQLSFFLRFIELLVLLPLYQTPAQHQLIGDFFSSPVNVSECEADDRFFALARFHHKQPKQIYRNVKVIAQSTDVGGGGGGDDGGFFG